MSTRLERRYVPKGASYTLVPSTDKPGTVFTNRDATGAITFTLFDPNRSNLGWWYRFKGVVDQSFTVQTNTADTLVVLNDQSADSLAVSTGGQKIGAEIEVVCIETAPGTYRWAASGIAVGHTYTVAT